MQLSNKILIGFFGFILLYIIAGFAEVRLRGTNRGNPSAPGAKIESAAIGTVRHLIVDDINQRVKVVAASESRIELHSNSGDHLSKLRYEIKGDTLTLKRLDLDQSISVHVYVAKNELKEIEVNESFVTINNFNQKVLSITQHGGNVRMTGNTKLEKMSITTSDAAAFRTDSSLHFDTLSVQIDNKSELIMWADIKRLEGTMTNESYLRIDGTDDIAFKKDESSKIHIMN